MAAYEMNTGETHPLVGGIVTLSRRDTGTGSDTLTDYYSVFWYGTISIGTPAVCFTGVPLFCPV
jgi:cathepsin D